MLENAVYSVLSPEGAASIIYKDAGKVKEAAEALKLSAPDMLAFGVIEGILEEGEGCEQAAASIRTAFREGLAAFRRMGGARIRLQRYERFRGMGGFPL